jgi:N-acyl-phosphatidylethanolamine-hydrolysing phospholipase D
MGSTTIQPPLIPPLPSEEDPHVASASASASTAVVVVCPPPSLSMRSRYLGWKSRRNEQYQGWKSRRKEQYQNWKIRRQELYYGWKQRRQLDWVRTKNIVLREYSRPEWFDALGRPITSKDSTGRYVNPWQSQSTNGLHSPVTLLKWRWQRFERFVQSRIEESGLSFSPASSRKELSPAMSQEQLLVDPLSPLPIPHSPDTSTIALTWIGHSTCYVQMHGFSMVMDPIFSHKSSPYQQEYIPIGETRLVPPSHSIPYLVDHAGGTIDFCCITHDHYDHMDRDSVVALVPHVRTWVVPLDIGSWLVEKGGVDPSNIVELEWWQSARFVKGPNGEPVKVADSAPEDPEDDVFTISCCPASHWGSRTMFDRNSRLWGSFAFSSPKQRFFFCGDTGLPETFPLFRQIGDAFGPFDLSCIPIGAYAPSDYNKDAHVNPEEAVKVHQDLMSRYSIGIHWGTFELGDEPSEEPPLKLKEVMEAQRTLVAPFETILHGRTVVVNHHETIPQLEDDQDHANHDEAVLDSFREQQQVLSVSNSYHH